MAYDLCLTTNGPLSDGPLSDGPLSDGPLSDGPLSDGPLSKEKAQALRLRIDEAASLAYCEVTPIWDEVHEPGDWGEVVSVSLSNDAVIAARAFRDLKQIAAEFGLRLYDPQVGEDVDLHKSSALPGMY